MKKCILSLFTASALSLNHSPACGDYGGGPDLLAALNGSVEAFAALASEYRSQGETGLISVLKASPPSRRHLKYAAFVDQVAKQKDALRSKLFWHTDFGHALAAAEESGRPILSLRLLGNLDEEYSCANSRLFREVLYPDPEVGKLLRENFVLHWKSVRPVPIMTIDFGDGRTLKRTITGNSAHYILDERGRVVDALPGLYTPEKFLACLSDARQFIAMHRGECSRTRPASLVEFHQKKLKELREDFATRLKRSGLSDVGLEHRAPMGMSDLTPQEWAKLAASEPKKKAQNRAVAANNLTRGKALMEVNLIEKVAEADLVLEKRSKLESATAEDSLMNEFVFHHRIHQRLSDRGRHGDLEELNRWVYSELFLMPDNDPWLGLHTPEVFTGLTNNGIVRP